MNRLQLIRRSLYALAGAALLAGAAPAQNQLCTIFSGGNGFAGNMWDASVLSDITVTSFDVHLQGTVGEACDMVFYTTPGTYLGVESDPTAWTQVGGTVTVLSNGSGVPTNADVADFSLTTGDYGMYMDQSSYSVNSHTVSYTNGNGANQSYSNAELDLTLGIGRGAPAFSGSIFTPRVWNGCINYDATGGFRVATNDPCPGNMTFSISGATPNASLAIVRANALGTTTVGAPCGTVTLGLGTQNLTLVGVVQADINGDASLSAPVPAIACGNLHGQVVDLSNCATSNTLSL